MQLTDILRPDCVKVPLAGRDKRSAVEELVQLLADRGRISDADAAGRAVWERENTRTTGIGHGIAIPHGKTDACDELVMAFGRADEPVEFGSIDGKPVQMMFLLISPPALTGPHIQVLARISRLMTRADVRRAILEGEDADSVYDVIAREEKLAMK